jgi:hypothetical protein
MVSSSSSAPFLALRLPVPWQDHSQVRAFGQRTPMRLHRISCLRGHRVHLLLRAREPLSAFRGNRAPAALLAYPIGGREGALGDGIEERAGRAPLPLVFPWRIEAPKLRLILFLAQVVDQVEAVVAYEDLVLFDGLSLPSCAAA